jgi:excisionase family DNA binding protein
MTPMDLSGLNEHPPERTGPLLTQREVEGLLQISKSAVDRLVRGGHLRVVHIGRSRRFHPDELTAFIAAASRPR